ncbi:hypothetical protein INT45_010349 [Circinella minor]|uniref:Reverse transcriptase domain-containing protein n=1 Tax=Circinella minor TaxID=1195481 RepID=A0A8H7SC40_9FUNG|nr:hypothetical protein INT45_010349 [Circinella minor]
MVQAVKYLGESGLRYIFVITQANKSGDSAQERVPSDRGFGHIIDTVDEKPVSPPSYKMPSLELDELLRQLNEYLNCVWRFQVHHHREVPYYFFKKVGVKMRMCVNYRATNKKTILIDAPLPRIDMCLKCLEGAKYFSSLNLRSGYHQIKNRESNILKTEFNTRLLLPVFMEGAPVIYWIDVDDGLIFSDSWDKHQEHIKMVLDKLRDNQLYVNYKKCEFGK